MWPDYIEPDDRSAFPAGDPRRDDYFYDTGDGYQWSDRRTNSYGLDWSFTKRYHHNELETGLDHQWQTVQYTDIEYPWVFDKNGLGESHDLWVAHPSVGALYARDRREYEGFIANHTVAFDLLKAQAATRPKRRGRHHAATFPTLSESRSRTTPIRCSAIA
jgi:hypothetical protein